MNARDLSPLVRRYAGRGPRYTSYPTAAQFTALPQTVAQERLRAAAQRTDEAWSLYAHVPFCQQRCHFCACAVVASPHHDRLAPAYVDDVLAELDLVTAEIGDRRGLAQLHLGGGTPTYLAPALLGRFVAELLRRFEPTLDFELSIEADPRVTTPAHLDVMAYLGVSRISLGVQDLDDDVQQAIGRIQPIDVTRATVEGARQRGISQLNIDLVYGLPHQTVASMTATVDGVLALRPDRVALYGYAHVPWMRGNQRVIPTRSLPVADLRLDMFLAARERFEAAGYRSIGLDHFALPDDPLALAYDDGSLHRNFMGYTVRGGTELLGLGVTAIGDVDGALLQNTTKLSRYREAVRSGQLPVERGIVRDAEDTLRGRVIADLMCRGEVCREEIAQDFAVDFDQHFGAELRALAPMITDGLLLDDGERLRLTPFGRTFVRNAAMPFDRHLPAAATRHSTTV